MAASPPGGSIRTTRSSPIRPPTGSSSQPKASGVLSLLVCGRRPWEPWNGRCPHPASPGIFTNTSPAPACCSRKSIRRSAWHSAGNSPSASASDWCGPAAWKTPATSTRSVRLLDGWHHLLPSGVSQETYARYSYLAAAYMRHEACPACGLGIYTLNSGITDRAEPCESLRVACAWSLGLDDATLLLSDRQVDAFRRGAGVSAETEVRGVFGAHLLATDDPSRAAGLPRMDRRRRHRPRPQRGVPPARTPSRTRQTSVRKSPPISPPACWP